MQVTLSRLSSLTLEPVTIEITYETTDREPIHPDPSVRWRFQEYAMSDCPAGCKIYKDPRSDVKVLYHSSVYGCRK